MSTGQGSSGQETTIVDNEVYNLITTLSQQAPGACSLREV